MLRASSYIVPTIFETLLGAPSAHVLADMRSTSPSGVEPK
jgi:hypothetical protein